MKMKIDNQNPTSHIFIGLMAYVLEGIPEEYKRYGFGFFELNDFIALDINQFHDQWEEGIKTYFEVMVDIGEFYLIDDEYILEEAHKKDNPDYEGVKLDSINFLKEKPDLDIYLTRKCKGSIFLNRNNFIVQAEIIPDGSGYSMAIFRSVKVNYWKINHLLKRGRAL
ncbi:MAG: hypothetical protein KBC43_11600 [Bacteroidales bacterium]|nr:hypothetical protein [Bacteroidales bacterium]